MLSAITASTGADGTWTKPSVASASVMLCAMVKAVTVFTSSQSARDEEQRQHEEQMIDAEQDVLDAEPEIERRPPTSHSGGGIIATEPAVSAVDPGVAVGKPTRTSASVIVSRARRCRSSGRAAARSP